jgi:acetyl-CoA carboxylase biotin carboxylase subunit
MIGKLIVHAEDRPTAIARAVRALDEYFIQGVKTSIPFARHIMGEKEFLAGHYDTGYIERLMNTGSFGTDISAQGL